MLQVDLSNYFSAHGALFNTNNAELTIARAFAAAANAAHESDQQHPTAEERVELTFFLNVKDTVWPRQLQDVLLRCVDRAMGRVYPPLDVLQYVSGDSPKFLPREEQGSFKGVRAVFLLRPSAFLLPSSLLKQHMVEGEVVDGVRLPEPENAAAITAAASELAKDSQLDMDLWYRARAAHQQYDSSIPLDSLQHVAGAHDEAAALAQQQRRVEKLAQLQWQLARWLVELFLNEGGWARPRSGASAASASSSTSSTSAFAGAGGDGGSRRLFHGPLRVAFPHVVDAAIFSQPAPQKADNSAEDAVPRRQLHADVRGLEWNGLLLGCTTRYAYIAVPYFVSAAESTGAPTCVWSLVSRVPIPSFAKAVATTTTDHAGASRKRTREAAVSDSSAPPAHNDRATASLAQRVLSRCFNVEEVMRHDTHAAAAFRLADVPHIVTVRAHRVYCARADATKQPQLPTPARPAASLCAQKPHPTASPYKLAMTLEDAYIVADRTAETDEAAAAPAAHWAASLFGLEEQAKSTSDTPGAASALAKSMHTFPDVVSVVRESCHRFVRSHERFCALYQRCTELKKQPTPPTTQAAQEVVDSGVVEAPQNEKVEIKEEENINQRQQPSDAATQLAAAAQELRLLRRAEEVYASVADSMSVHYKKLRGAARVPIPLVRTGADVAALVEGNNVEFKAKVGLNTATGAKQQRGSTMDTERLRNTIAAMAACRGGVILIGVADDGRVIGHAKQLEVSKHLRISGFCPAMVKDTVQVRELRWRDTQAATAATETPAKRAMPANWWKAGGAARAATGSSRNGADGSTTAAGGAQEAAAELVLTVISVEKGQAPFYATAKNTPPYQRGCASTVVMPTMVLARRLMKELQ